MSTNHCQPDRIEALVYGEMPAGDAAALLAHVAACVDCARDRAFYEAERAALARLAHRHEVPPFLWTRVEGNLAKPAGARGFRRWLPQMSLAAAALAIAALFVTSRERSAVVVSQPAPVVPAAAAPASVDEARHAVEEAEAAQLAAIAALEQVYQQRRGELDAELAVAMDEEIARYRKVAAAEPALAKDNFEFRVKRLSALAAHRRAMQAVIVELEDKP